MAVYPHERPGWYRDPDDPRKLRYWDGTSWTGRARRQPPWASRAEALEVGCDDFDRSIEGPVHPRELRQPVASGAWSREWLTWRGHPPVGAWHRRGSSGGASSGWAARPQPAAKGGQARRPLLALVCLVLVAVAVVVSSVAFMSPYARHEMAVQRATARADSHFAALANADCTAVLPKYRGVLANSVSGPAVAAAASEVDRLRTRLSSLPVSQLASATVIEWLGAWRHFTDFERRYAAMIGRPWRDGGQVSPHKRVPGATAAVARAREQAQRWASFADQFTANLRVTACSLGRPPAA